MSAVDLVQALKAAGGSVQLLGGGKAKLVGVVPDEVLEGIKSDRDAFLDAWQRAETDRYLAVPPVDLVMCDKPPKWRLDVYHRVERYVRTQGPEVTGWAVLRASAYRENFPMWTDREVTASALRDVLQWQMGRYSDPVAQLKTFDEVANAPTR